MNPVKLILIALVLAIAESAKQCPPGSYIVKSGVCRLCPKGNFQPKANKYACKPCPPNTIAKKPGSTKCTACPNDRIPHDFRHKCICKDPSFEEDGKCVKCKPGTFMLDPDDGFCYNCEPGHFQPDAGQSDCLLCPDGTVSGYGATECFVCKDDEQFNKRENKCEKCKAGYAVQYDGCSKCPKDTYKPKAGPGACLPCPIGSHSDPGSKVCTPCPHGTVLFRNGKCGSCKAGWYFDAFERKCRKCHFNEFTPKRNVRTSCYSCSGKKFALKGSTKCVRCPKHKFLRRDGTCKPCPKGSVFWRYHLKCHKCGVNEFTRGDEEYCERCPERSYSYPGSTTCFQCKKDEAFILKRKKCVKCPAGRYYDEYDAKCRLCYESSFKRQPGLGDCRFCPVFMTSNENRTACVPE